jgi:hypothetical protein
VLGGIIKRNMDSSTIVRVPHILIWSVQVQRRLLFVAGTILVFGISCADTPPPAAEYPEDPIPAEEPIEVVLEIAGSEGGAYEVRAEQAEEEEIGEQWGTLFSLGDPEYEGILSSKPKKYRFDMGDGVRTDSSGDLEWDHININVDKDGDWEGEMYAKLFVNGELADCEDTSGSAAIRFVWYPPEGTGSWLRRWVCGTYPGF